MKTAGQIKLLEMQPEIEKKAAELSEKLKVEVTPFAFIIAGDQVIIGYLKEVDRLTKMRAIDMYDQSRTQAGDIILKAGLIREESDIRMLSEERVNDSLYLGAIEFAVKSVSMYSEQLKKK